MKNYFKVALISLGMLSVVSCSDDDSNQAPSAPIVQIPANEAIDVTREVTLSWTKSEDPESGLVLYDVYIGTSAELTDADIKAKKQTAAQFKTQLAGHTKYFWKVVATDNEGAVVESELCSFTTENSAPAKSTGEFPAHEAKGVAKSITFKWTEAVDADGDALTYTLYLAKKNTFADADKLATDLKTTQFVAAELDVHTEYFWKVSAKDSEGETIDSDVYSFTTLNTAPTQPEITEVKEEIVSEDLTLLVKWSACTDADKDAVVYDLYMTVNNEFADADLVKGDISETEFVATSLSYYANYKIKVVSKDNFGAEVASEIFEHKTQMKEGEIYLSNGTFTDARDNHEYKTVTINGTTWMAENFAYLPYLESDDDQFKKASVAGASDAADVATAKAHENFAKYGVMYSWDMLEDLAPEGWHVATEAEWQALEKLAGISDDDIERKRAYRETAVAAMFKSTEEWEPAGTNDLGLNIVKGGTSKFSFFGGNADYKTDSRAYYWTADEQSEGSQFAYMRAFTDGKIGVYRNAESKNNRNYIRLVKDNK
eukprot:TRINITY_DN1045_c3_g1_i1.p1 TRINITY_DN1045_c3_g1~~TRINITY_DN1045_c3_g1_i1.p1  ORF type:complete len:543 (-),score=107.82 TRINITY_DN1045_c3_g1_i1:850-2478(-)